MDLPNIARATAQTLVNYLTYQAVRLVVEQLTETNPPVALWLRQFSQDVSFQTGSEDYLQVLMRERQDLALRIMTVRQHLAENIPEFLPEMARSFMQDANLNQRRLLFERLTQTPPDLDPRVHPELDPVAFPQDFLDG